MIYSQPCEYAIRALIHMACQPEAPYIQAQDIAKAENIPAPYLAKLLQRLAKQDILMSKKGPGGGFKFRTPPAQVTLFDVIAVFDRPEDLESQCAIGYAVCSDNNPCPLHFRWKGLRLAILEYFRTVTFSDMTEVARQKGNHVGVPADFMGILPQS